MITDEEISRTIRVAQALAQQQWWRDGRRCDLAEYHDAAMTALAGCLSRFEPHRGVAFDSYAWYRISGAVRDALPVYENWRHGVNVGSWKHAPPNAHVFRPMASAQPDPVLRVWFLRQVASLSPCTGRLLVQLLTGDELAGIARAEGISYDTIYKRYLDLRKALRMRLARAVR